MRHLWLVLCALLSLPLLLRSALAEEAVVLGLSQDKVAITATFNGSELLVFGAVKRDAPIPERPLNVIVAISGPSSAIAVRRKDRRFGIWVNAETVRLNSAPSFYAVASSAPMDEALSQVDDLRYKITIPRMIRSVGATAEAGDVENFVDALIRLKTRTGAYQLLENGVTLDEQTLFRTTIRLPSDLTEGAYPTRIFLTRDGTVITMLETVIDVHKVGLERWLFTLSRENALAYGFLALAIAVFAGWGASALFRLLQRG